MARVQTSVVIERPVDEVFEFVTDPQNEALRGSLIVEQVKTSERPMGVGTRLRNTVKFLGRQFDTTFKITEHEVNKRSSVRTLSGPMPVTGCRIVELVEGGTRFTQITEGEVGGFFRLTEPLVIRAARRQYDTDLATLRDILEAQG